MTAISYDPEIVLVITTEGSPSEAENLAKELLQRKLAACISCREVNSFFWWEGDITHSNEVELLIKTTKDKYKSLINSIHQLHSYKNPELIHFKAFAGLNYKQWISEST